MFTWKFQKWDRLGCSWCQSGPQLISSLWFTIPVFIFVTHGCQMPITAPESITSCMARRGRERGQKKGFSLRDSLLFSVKGKCFEKASNHMIRPTCKGSWESNYLAFPASIVDRGERLGMTCVRQCTYMCVCGIYTFMCVVHIHI